MWRNGRSDSGESASKSSGVGKLMSLVGGIGLGAGLLYLLDPENGRKRRRSLLGSVQNLGGGIGDTVGGWLGSARDYASDAAGGAYDSVSSAVGSVGSTAGKYLGKARDYVADTTQGARQYAVESLGGEMPGNHKVGLTICALSSMAVGAALMYVFDPNSGKGRRRVVRDYASDAGRKVADAVSTGYDTVSGAVGKVAAKVGIGGGEDAGGDQGGSQSAGGPAFTSRTGGRSLARWHHWRPPRVGRCPPR